MKKVGVFSMVFIMVNLMYAQEKLVTRTAKVMFFSETPVENITAENTQTASIFLVDEKTIAFNVLLKSFNFEKALMEEHFNEKYVHSDEYPSAKFKGIIEDDIDLGTPSTYKDVTIKGDMDFHGVSRPITVIADITVNEDKSISLISNFILNLDDYNIEVPSLVKEKISKDIKVSVEAEYSA